MGQVPDSGNTNEEEKDQLDDIEALLDSKIKDAVSKQIKRLADTADGVDDPADALALLYQGKDIFNSVKMARMSKIDDTLPQPAEINTCAYIGLPLPEVDLLPEAFSNMDTADLYQALIDMQQEAIGRWSDLTKPLYPAGVTPDVDQQNQETFAQILDYLEQVGAAHYEIVRAGLYLHIFLSQLYDKWGAFPFLSGKGYVEAALLRYNAHTPYLAVGLEEQELQGVQSLLAVVNRAYTYIESPDFYKYREQATSTPASTAQQGTGTPISSTPGFGPQPATPATYAARVGLVKKMPSHKRPAGEQEGKDEKAKKKKLVAQVATQLPPLVPVAEVSIDLSADRDPKDVLNDIQTAIQGLIEKGLDLIYSLKQLARPVNFNIYTLQFGEATPLQDNRTMMLQMRKDIYQFILKDLQTSATLEPKIFLKILFVTKAFAGRYGAGPVVDALTLDPGEEREISHETTVTTKRMTSESDSVFDAKTTSVKDSLEKSRQNQLSKNTTDSTDVTDYVDKSNEKTTTDNQHLGANIDVTTPWVNGGVEYNTDHNTTATTGEQSGSNTTTNSAVETATNNIEGMIQNHAEDVTANRERTTTTTAQQEQDLETKDKETRKIKNPNRASPMTILFCKVIQSYNAITCSPGFHVIFANGSLVKECALSAFPDTILNKYIKTDAADTRTKIWDIIKSSAKMVDHQGRVVSLLDETGDVVRMRGNELYFSLLKESNYQLKAADVPLTLYKNQLKGVVLSTREYTLPQCGLLSRAIVGDPALDDNEQQLLSNEIEKTNWEVQIVQNNYENGKAFREFFNSITDVDQKIKAGFLLMQAPGDILQKGTLNYVAGLNGTGNHGDINKLKSLLQSLKLDV